MLNLDTHTTVGDIIAVSGYRKGCGKTQLAMYLAEQAAAEYSVCLVTQSDRMETSAYNTITQKLSKPCSFTIAHETPSEPYDVVVYDHLPADVKPTAVYYITSSPQEDPELGIVDQSATDFRRKVYNAVFAKFEVVPVFVEETLITLYKERERDLEMTDWVVIRELERMFLQGTEIGNARRFLREVKNKDVSTMHTFK